MGLILPGRTAAAWGFAPFRAAQVASGRSSVHRLPARTSTRRSRWRSPLAAISHGTGFPDLAGWAVPAGRPVRDRGLAACRPCRTGRRVFRPPYPGPWCGMDPGLLTSACASIGGCVIALVVLPRVR